MSRRRGAYLGPLTSLRFLAAFHVLLFHGAREWLWRPFLRAPEWAQGLLATGYAGVGFFFVLSGFILSYTYRGRLDGARERREFWRARFARVYPVYALGLLLFAPIELLGGRPGTVAPSALSCVTLTQAWIPAFALRWNTPGWSLSVEAF
ncbi:MAG TPA: acyltransferase family protein, partial [Elusimicrobiota bacterium]|nr:acyltransferase family protein [Elusimicrobiota bacterium]